jgi:hypothetical protein
MFPPEPINPQPDAGYLDTILRNRYVVFAIRLVLASFAAILLFAGLYLIGSIAHRIVSGHWLRRVGWFEAETEDVEAQLERALAPRDEALQQAAETIGELAGHLESSNEEIEALRRENEELRAKVQDR